MGIQTRQREFQAWRPGRSAGNQTARLPPRINPPRLLFGSPKTGKYTPGGSSYRGPGRIHAGPDGVSICYYGAQLS